ncbi:MAG: HAD family hydrolase [Candidatus Riflebacteria bacterium]|nr:HAD family hydrolase [Candidatus Riflebacteria bacterium]
MIKHSTHRQKFFDSPHTNKYPIPRAFFVDVDGTLHRFGRLNTALVNIIKQKKDEGFFIVLWSSRGQKYAEDYADSQGIRALFDVIISKPGIIADDMGVEWSRYCKFIPLVLLDNSDTRQN